MPPGDALKAALNLPDHERSNVVENRLALAVGVARRGRADSLAVDIKRARFCRLFHSAHSEPRLVRAVALSCEIIARVCSCLPLSEQKQIERLSSWSANKRCRAHSSIARAECEASHRDHNRHLEALTPGDLSRLLKLMPCSRTRQLSFGR